MGSGKSTVARILIDRGYDVLDADRVVGQVLGRGEPAVEEIARALGDDLLGADGTLDRRGLAARVFGNPERLARLESIVHPRVRARVAEARAEMKSAGRAVAFYDVPLLFEKKMEADFDFILVVSAPRAVRLARAMARTGLSEAEIEARWANQLSPEYKEARASAVIHNDGGEPELRARTLDALERLKIPDAGSVR